MAGLESGLCINDNALKALSVGYIPRCDFSSPLHFYHFNIMSMCSISMNNKLYIYIFVLKIKKKKQTY